MAHTLQEFVDTTSIHGPAAIYYAKSSVGRLYWSLIFAVMIGTAVYFTYSVIRSYLTAPVATQVSAVHPSSMTLPEVAICYSEAVDAAKLLQNGLSEQAVRAVNKQFLLGKRSVEDFATWAEDAAWFKAAKSEIFEFAAKRNITGYNGFVEYASFDCGQLILEYHPFSQTYRSKRSCNLLKTIPHNSYGTCYILPSIEQNWPFVFAGWTVLLKAPLEYDLVQNLHYTRSFAVEFAQTFEVASYDSYKLPLNRSVNLALQQTTFKRVENRQWPRAGKMRCLNYASNKTNRNCYDLCYTYEIIKRCKCLPFDAAKALMNMASANYSVCWPDEQYKCKQALGMEDPCSKNCSPLCDETTYGAIMSYADLRAEQIIAEFGLAGNTQGVIHLQIGYNTLLYTSIEEEDTIGIGSCISDIGGMFGLWLGGSIFTIIHFLTTLCGCCRCPTQKSVTQGAERSVSTTKIGEKK